MDWTEISVIISAFGGILAVWIRAEISIAVLKANAKSLEKAFEKEMISQKAALEEIKQNHKDFSSEIKEALGKIFDKMSDIERELGQKVSISKNGHQ